MKTILLARFIIAINTLLFFTGWIVFLGWQQPIGALLILLTPIAVYLWILIHRHETGKRKFLKEIQVLETTLDQLISQLKNQVPEPPFPPGGPSRFQQRLAEVAAKRGVENPPVKIPRSIEVTEPFIAVEARKGTNIIEAKQECIHLAKITDTKVRLTFNDKVYEINSSSTVKEELKIIR